MNYIFERELSEILRDIKFELGKKSLKNPLHVIKFIKTHFHFGIKWDAIFLEKVVINFEIKQIGFIYDWKYHLLYLSFLQQEKGSNGLNISLKFT